MGIKQEIEKRRLTEQTLLDEYARQKRETIRKLEAVEDRNWTIAMSLASGCVQKFKESGVAEVLDELIKEEHLCAWSVRYDMKRGRYRALASYETKPAETEIVLDVHPLDGTTATQLYRMVGFDLKPIREPVKLPEDHDETNPVETNPVISSKFEIQFLARLRWNQDDLHESYDELKFSLYRRNDSYELELTGVGDGTKPLLFPECSWNRKQLEQAVVEAYLNPLFRHHSTPPDDLDNNS